MHDILIETEHRPFAYRGSLPSCEALYSSSCICHLLLLYDCALFTCVFITSMEHANTLTNEKTSVYRGVMVWPVCACFFG